MQKYYFQNIQRIYKPEHWLEIAKKVDSVTNSDYTGIIIAHGTDTMHYSSAFFVICIIWF